MDKLKEAVEAHWGERCDEAAEGCPICDAWAEYDGVMLRLEEADSLKDAAQNVLANSGSTAIALDVTLKPRADL